MALQATPVRRAIEVRATGSTVLGIAYKRLKYVRLPVPPLREQREITRRAEQLLSFADRVEARALAASTKTTSLPQAILAKAFSGELVPTEAELARAEGREYESASALLALLVKSAVEGKAAKPVGNGRTRDYRR